MFEIKAQIKKHGDYFVGWVEGDKFRGVVVQGFSEGEVMKELRISIIAQISFLLGLHKEKKGDNVIRIPNSQLSDININIVA